MTQIQNVQKAAQDLRRFAQTTELPGYATMMHRAADDLERRLAELCSQDQDASSRRTI